MSKVLLTTLILGLFAALSLNPDCHCLPASDADKPHGANMLIEHTGVTVTKIKGRVIYPDGEPVNDAVVELFDYEDRDARPYQITQFQKRRAACLTGKDGRFCFTNLSSGLYALRIGTRTPAGMNEAHVKVNLDRRWWRRWLRPGKDIDVYLEPGT
jgi:protocatechuate 3,4-dioxygenase beta subunit